MLAYHRPPKHPRALRLLAALINGRKQLSVSKATTKHPPPQLLFALTASTTSATSPLVFNGITCPTCAAPRQPRSIRSGPLTIHDVAGPFFFTGYAYACTRTLSAVLECEFPYIYGGGYRRGPDMWNGGVSRVLWSLVLGVLRAGLGRSVILQLVRGVQPSCLEFYYRFCTEPSAYSVPSFDAAEPAMT
ncbi:hypothetical protein B0H14DRAFT_3540306 [Mycena olivaceomarginata]|nr:hypothetical protein B0H14DRAFT_3540306 [Mycena olivaceomarginata]